MVQHTAIALEPEIEIESISSVATCRHHWVIQPADGPVSNGLCQVCGETREFKNYVESATWGDSRITSKGAFASDTVDSTSDDDINENGIGTEPESAVDEVEVEV